jgi:hypothetical protein
MGMRCTGKRRCCRCCGKRPYSEESHVRDRDHARKDPRGLLVRPAVPLGLDDLPVGAGSGEGPRHRGPLAHHEPGGAQRAQARRAARGVPRAARHQGVEADPRGHRRLAEARLGHPRPVLHRARHPHPQQRRGPDRRGRRRRARRRRPARRPDRLRRPGGLRVRRRAARLPQGGHRQGRPGRRHPRHRRPRPRRRADRLLRPGRHPRPQGRGGRPPVGRHRRGRLGPRFLRDQALAHQGPDFSNLSRPAPPRGSRPRAVRAWCP